MSCVVTTLLLPQGGHEPLLSFVRWHLHLGIERLYLYFDDDTSDEPVGWTELEALLDELDARHFVERFRRTPELADEWRRCASFARFGAFVNEEVQARQALNAEHASLAAREAGLRWLVHIDIDELLYASSKEALVDHFEAMDAAGVGHVTYANHEGVPETDAVDYFSAVTLFKRNHLVVPLSDEARQAMRWWRDRTRRGQYLLCYDNGKSAVRLVPGIAPTSVHAWSVPGLRRRTALADPRGDLTELAHIEEPCVLHYVACGAFWLRTKYEILGNFDDAWFGGALPIAPSFHLDARDVVAKHDPSLFQAFYDAHVALRLDSDRLNAHLAAGVLRRYTTVANLLSSSTSSNTTQRQEPIHPSPPPQVRDDQDASAWSYEKAWIVAAAAQSYL